MTLDEFVAVVLIVALIPVAIIQWMGLIVAIIDGVRDWRKKTMIDYKKAQKADKLLLESGVPFMLVYDNTDKHMICRAFGNYPTLKEFIVTMMVQAVVNVQSKYGEEAAMKELMGMMTEAAQQYCEETKKEAEKHEVLN